MPLHILENLSMNFYCIAALGYSHSCFNPWSCCRLVSNASQSQKSNWPVFLTVELSVTKWDVTYAKKNVSSRFEVCTSSGLSCLGWTNGWMATSRTPCMEGHVISMLEKHGCLLQMTFTLADGWWKYSEGHFTLTQIIHANVHAVVFACTFTLMQTRTFAENIQANDSHRSLYSKFCANARPIVPKFCHKNTYLFGQKCDESK